MINQFRNKNDFCEPSLEFYSCQHLQFLWFSFMCLIFHPVKVFHAYIQVWLKGCRTEHAQANRSSKSYFRFDLDSTYQKGKILDQTTRMGEFWTKRPKQEKFGNCPTAKIVLQSGPIYLTIKDNPFYWRKRQLEKCFFVQPNKDTMTLTCLKSANNFSTITIFQDSCQHLC